MLALTDQRPNRAAAIAEDAKATAATKARQDRGLAIAACCNIVAKNHNQYIVPARPATARIG